MFSRATRRWPARRFSRRILIRRGSPRQHGTARWRQRLRRIFLESRRRPPKSVLTLNCKRRRIKFLGGRVCKRKPRQSRLSLSRGCRAPLPCARSRKWPAMGTDRQRPYCRRPVPRTQSARQRLRPAPPLLPRRIGHHQVGPLFAALKNQWALIFIGHRRRRQPPADQRRRREWWAARHRRRSRRGVLPLCRVSARGGPATALPLSAF